MTELSTGVGELIQRLKNDGVKAGEGERARILDDARAEAKRIVDGARADAKRILDDAARERETQTSRLNAELRLAARDFVTAFRQRFAQRVVRPHVGGAVSGAVSDPAFLKSVLQELVVAWMKGGGQGVSLVVDAEQKAKLESFFKESLSKEMELGRVVVEGAPGLAGFRLKRTGETFSWDVTDDAVAGEIANLVEPSLRAHFVGEG